MARSVLLVLALVALTACARLAYRSVDPASGQVESFEVLTFLQDTQASKAQATRTRPDGSRATATLSGLDQQDRGNEVLSKLIDRIPAVSPSVP